MKKRMELDERMIAMQERCWQQQQQEREDQYRREQQDREDQRKMAVSTANDANDVWTTIACSSFLIQHV